MRRLIKQSGLLIIFCLFVMGGLAWGENPCGECHEEQVQALAKTPHARVGVDGESFCVACHGDPQKHLESGEAQDILGPQKLEKASAEQRAQACLQCHRASWPTWEGGAHAQNGVSCWDCHSDVWHRPAPQSGSMPELAQCTSCHEGVAAEFKRPWRHPVQEGQVTCVSCHDVHAQEEVSEVVTQRCGSCHSQNAGPFVFPHRAMDEGCNACHAPHGSTNRSLLRASGNGLCIRCHVQSNFPGVGKVPHNFNLIGGARCYDCHSEVHGSNADELFAPRLAR